MKKMILLAWLVVSIPAILFAQGKVEAPVWNVGDKWVFTQRNIEVIGADKKSYALNFCKDTCILENMGFETIIFEKSTLNRTYILKGDMREKYTLGRRRILNFPFNPGKQWQDTFTAKRLVGGEYIRGCSESFTVLGWENVQVQAGKFKSIRLEYTQKQITPAPGAGWEGWIRYWDSPEVKYFVKCQYDKNNYMGVNDWEIVSFKGKK